MFTSVNVQNFTMGEIVNMNVLLMLLFLKLCAALQFKQITSRNCYTITNGN